MDGLKTRNNFKNPRIKHYWNFRDEISSFDVLMLKGEKMIIPKSMQKSVIEQIHKKSHLVILELTKE